MSNKEVFYRQCRLKRKTKTGHSIQTSWIPKKFAEVGKILKLKNHEDEWENGWVVETVSETILEESQLPDYHIAIKSHRKATGDSLPK